MPWLIAPVVSLDHLTRTQPALTADGLVLRPWRDDDAANAVAAFADPAVRHWQGRSLDSEAEAVTWVHERHQRWATKTGVSWAITENGTNNLQGQVGLWGIDLSIGSAALSYWVLEAARGGQVASRAVAAVTQWAFEVCGLRRLEITHAVINSASCRVAEKQGFSLEGTKRNAMVRTDGWHDTHVHARLRNDNPINQ